MTRVGDGLRRILERCAQYPTTTASMTATVVILVSVATKWPCLNGVTGFWRATGYCYSDLIALWDTRGYDVGAVPYAPAPSAYPGPYLHEYPPGLTFPAWALARAVDSETAFLLLHAVTFVAAAVLTVILLDRTLRLLGHPRTRVLGFALSPTLLVFGAQNWDLWTVAIASIVLYEAARRRPLAAAIWAGAGAAVKWWPGLLVVAALHPSRDRDRWRGIPVVLAAAALAWAALQTPALLVSLEGWRSSIAVHLARGPNPDSSWGAVHHLLRELGVNASTMDRLVQAGVVVAFVVGGLGLAVVAHRVVTGRLASADGALAAVGLALVTSEVFSPQFVLWLLPVAVVSSAHWRYVLPVEVANLAVWAAIAPWLVAPEGGREWLLVVAQSASVARTVAIVVLIAHVVRANRSGGAASEGTVMDGG